MNVSLYQAAAAMSADSRWQDAIAENIASTAVTGFRKHALATSAVQAGLLSVNSSNSPQYFSVPNATITTSFQAGEMNFTGNTQDAGIDGAGFFQVKLANGEVAVTRDGEFRVNSKGLLVSKEGYVVLSNAENPIQLDAKNRAPISISAAGDVLQGSEVKGKIGLTDFENPQLLTSTNGVYFLTDNPALKTQDATGSLRDEFVEAGNATSLQEMASLMEVMRGFEANQHVVQIQDDRLGKVISELGATGAA